MIEMAQYILGGGWMIGGLVYFYRGKHDTAAFCMSSACLFYLMATHQAGERASMKSLTHIELRFDNYCDVDEGLADGPITSIISCAAINIHEIMSWYGSYHAGDRYYVFKNGAEVPIDKNGEPRPKTIDVRASYFQAHCRR